MPQGHGSSASRLVHAGCVVRSVPEQVNERCVLAQFTASRAMTQRVHLGRKVDSMQNIPFLAFCVLRQKSWVAGVKI